MPLDPNTLPRKTVSAGPLRDPSTLPTGLILSAATRDAVIRQLQTEGSMVEARALRPGFPPPPPSITLLYPLLLLACPDWIYGLQGTGDCMAWSACHNLDVLKAAQILLLGRPEIYLAQTSIEAQYALMRVEAYHAATNTVQAGASPEYAARSVLKCGTLHRLNYKDQRYDLRQYDSSGRRSDSWGNTGLPDILEPIASEHPARKVSLVTSFEEACGLLEQGIPISAAAPNNPIYRGRDATGLGTKAYYASHAMNYIGFRREPNPALLKSNTGHGYHVEGPRWPEDLPDQIAHCSAWEPADVCDDVLSQKWSWAYADYVGLPAQPIAPTSPLYELIHPTIP